MAIPDGADDVLLLMWHGAPGDSRMWYSARYAITSPPGGWRTPTPAGPCTGSPGVAQAGHFAYQGPPGLQQSHLFEAQYSEGGISSSAAPAAGPAGPFQSASRPALGGFYGTSPVLAWRRLTDGAVVTSLKKTGGWAGETTVGHTSHAAALSADGQAVVWKGADVDTRMFISLRAGDVWEGQEQLIPTRGEMLTTDAPSLSLGRPGNPYRYVLAWRGTDAPGQIYWSTSPGRGWSDAIPAIPKSGSMLTSHGPAIYQWSGGLTMVWKGAGGDPRLWWSDYDAAAGKWATPGIVAGANSDSGPCLGGVAEAAFDTDQ
jgi:hypothetical protein